LTFTPLDFFPREMGLALSSIKAKQVIQLPLRILEHLEMCFGAFSEQP